MTARDYLALADIEYTRSELLTEDLLLNGILLGIGQQLRRIADALTPELPHHGTCPLNHGPHGPGCSPFCACHKPELAPGSEKPEPVNVSGRSVVFASVFLASEGEVRLKLTGIAHDLSAYLNPAHARQVADALNANAAWIEAQ